MKLPTLPSHKFAACLSLVTTLVLFLLLRLLGPFTYAGSDDFYLDLVASGNLTGGTTLHLLHLGTLPALLLATLYTALPMISWYGFFLLGAMFLALSHMLYLALISFKPSLWLLRYVVMITLEFGLLGQFILQLQYTTVAGIVMTAVLLGLIVKDCSMTFTACLKTHLPELCLFALAYSIRSEVALMMSLPLLLLLLSKAIHQKSRSSFLFPASGLLSLLVVLVLIDLAAYSGTTWSAYRTYNASRESIVDYDGYPAFDTHEDAYRTLGITESSYVAASSYYALAQDPHWTAESMQTLAEISAKEHSLEHVSGQVIYLRLTGQLIRISSEILRDWFETDNRPCNLISLVLFVLFALLTIGQLCKCRWEALIAFLAVLVSHYALMGYLYYIGRHPYRVTQCIYIAEIFWLLFLLLRYEVSRFPLFLSALVLILTVRFAPHKLLDTARTSASILTYSENYEALRAYTDAHPDTLYLTDTLSVTYFTKNALQAASYEANVLPLGTWCAGSPWYSAVFSSFGITDASQLLLDDPQSAFLIMDLGQEDPASYLTAYYEEYLGKEVNATVADTIDCSEDIRFYVITLSSAQPAGK